MSRFGVTLDEKIERSETGESVKGVFVVHDRVTNIVREFDSLHVVEEYMD